MGLPEHEITEEMIARRAYEISQSGDAGTPEENWRRAEEELRRGVPSGRREPGELDAGKQGGPEA